MLLATDRRLVFIADDEATYLPYSAIERVGRGKSLLGSYVALHTRGHEVRIKWINSRRVRPFVRTRARRRARGPAAPALALGRALRVRASGRGQPALARLGGELRDDLVERLDARVDAAVAAHRDACAPRPRARRARA